MIGANEFLRTKMNVLSRGFIPPEEVEAVERQPIAMTRSHISWGSVIAGSLLTISLLALSSCFAYACGVPAFSVSDVDYGFGTGVWSVITAIIAFGAGGWLAACLASTLDSRFGILHGVVVWGLTIPLLLFLGERTGIFGSNGTIQSNIREMVLIAPSTGGAWGALVSMVAGLAAAIIGGGMLYIAPRSDVASRPSRYDVTGKPTV